ncbi:alpha/beta hydrolase [Streptomyces shenzhenensis]|uniref:alpha/beta hydrolase family protein n=1 Tax=Streptomyces shenzhenensis TaxID=943815 RepID=UPI0011C370C0|nr:alpha/beta hydrolase [Streptomyces shenzhenensis]
MKRRIRVHARARGSVGGALLAALLLGAGLTGTSGVAAAADAGPAGRTATVTESYDLGDTAFADPVSGTVSEIRAVVHRPGRVSGRLPLVVLSHGSWYACTDPAATAWPCERGRPYPSYRGYDYLGQALAERGFVVVSLSADGINMTSFDYGDRARLINEHLRLWQQLSSGGGVLARSLPALRGHVDMRRVGTVGHSRGGKGVMWQASDKHQDEVPGGVRLGAVLALAPVKFDGPEGDNSDTLVTRTPVAVVTSGCDGAVGEAGQEYLDDVEGRTTEPAYSVSLRDGNHNFYNTQWTPPTALGEDDSTCPGRGLGPATQQNALTAYATAFFDQHLKGDATGEALLTGERALPGVAATTRVVRPAAGR